MSVEFVKEPQPDSKYLFGRDNATAKTDSARCDGQLGIDGFEWRLAQFNQEEGEMRIGGISLRCNRWGGVSVCM